jgi:hypothetical protein
MGVSYILMLTAFYVDNGKNLPLWSTLPSWVFWILPALIGTPAIVYALMRADNDIESKIGSANRPINTG